MARVTVEDCAEKVTNRFELVLIATKRARRLSTGAAQPFLEWENDKPTVLALREIAAGYTFDENDEGTTEMSKTNIDIVEDQLTVEQWLAIRKEAGSEIDPETAEVFWCYAETLDPSGVDPDLPDEECYKVGRAYFARSPESDIWVWFGDLPREVGERVWKLHSSKLAFPAGLPRSWGTRRHAPGPLKTHQQK